MELKNDFVEFQKEIDKRSIEFLVHFTSTINLLSIFEQGKILSRANIEKFNIEQTDLFDYIEFTDNIRYDDKRYINLSIQHPNSALLSNFNKKKSNLPYVTWCILTIDPKYIYQKETLFSITNAANSYNKRNIGVTGDLTKFKMMFDNNLQVVTSYNTSVKTRGNLLAKFPTDEQAEVLVMNEIQISDIINVCFKDETDLSSAKAALFEYKTNNFIVDTSIFRTSRI